jgi:glycosyltransferase involved in cell wall biosynthesis
MHIIMTLNSTWNAWNFRKAMVEALIADDHEVTVLAPLAQNVRSVENLGCRVIHLDMNVKGLSPLDDIKLLFNLRKIFSQEQPDVVLTYTIKNNIYGALAAKSLNISIIPNITGLGTAFLAGGFLGMIVKILYEKALRQLPCVFFQNVDDSRYFVDHGIVQKDQIYLLPGSGVDLEHFHKTPFSNSEAGPIFLMISRIIKDKGVLEYVGAARELKQVWPHARFQLLGNAKSENRTAIDALTVQSWHEEGVIEYLGTTDDVRPFIAASNCIVLPSYREGAPRALIEAAAMARPVIATDVPGCRSVVEDEITGFLCRERSVASLVNACRKFLTLPLGRQAAMGRAGRMKIEREFDQKRVVNEYRKAIAATVSNLQKV